MSLRVGGSRRWEASGMPYWLGCHHAPVGWGQGAALQLGEARTAVFWGEAVGELCPDPKSLNPPPPHAGRAGAVFLGCHDREALLPPGTALALARRGLAGPGLWGRGCRCGRPRGQALPVGQLPPGLAWGGEAAEVREEAPSLRPPQRSLCARPLRRDAFACWIVWGNLPRSSLWSVRGLLRSFQNIPDFLQPESPNCWTQGISVQTLAPTEAAVYEAIL